VKATRVSSTVNLQADPERLEGTRPTLLSYDTTVRHTIQSADLGEWTSQLRRGVLELCLLRLLSREPNYGYQIVAALNVLGPLAAGENTIYPLLRRLKADKFLSTFMKNSEAGPPRQYYEITPLGLRRLALLENEWASMVSAVEQCAKKG
jgi:PadR family transcriptional regulator, regulatory protein PadR